MRRLRCFLILAVAVTDLIVGVACKNRSDSTAQAAGGDNQAQGQNATAQAPPAADQTVTIPEGTTLYVRLLDPIGSASDASGETFRATLDGPIVVNGIVAVEKDVNLTGKVLVARSAELWWGTVKVQRSAQVSAPVGAQPLPMQPARKTYRFLLKPHCASFCGDLLLSCRLDESLACRRSWKSNPRAPGPTLWCKRTTGEPRRRISLSGYCAAQQA